jgi:hypothetical protein
VNRPQKGGQGADRRPLSALCDLPAKTPPAKAQSRFTYERTPNVEFACLRQLL